MWPKGDSWGGGGLFKSELNQPRLAAALESGAGLPDQYLVNAVVWEYRGLELTKRRFVGGYYPNGTGVMPIQLTDEGQLVRRSPDPLRLDVGEGKQSGSVRCVFQGPERKYILGTAIAFALVEACSFGSGS